MKKTVSKPRKRTQNQFARNGATLSAQELRLLQKLKSDSLQTYESLVHIVYHLVELSPPAKPKISKKEYLNDPLWTLVGRGSSGRKNDDSAIAHDRYLYGGEA